jgi:hypothetical protein
VYFWTGDLQRAEAISCPFDDDKQLHGCPLKIIGFSVDINAGMISLAPDYVSDICEGLIEFLATPG